MKSKKRILLVQPLGYKESSAKRDISRIAGIMPPLGLASMSAYLEKKEIGCDIIDCYAHPGSQNYIRDYLQNNHPAFIGLSCITSNFSDGIQIASMAKALQPEIKVVFGGPHVSALREKVLEKYPLIDFVVAGEGEETVEQLVRENGENPETIPGIIYRDAGGKTGFAGYREKGIDLDLLPFPAYEKLKGYPDAYKMPIFNYPRTPGTSCITSRGCPYSCSYCDRSVFRKSFRYNSAEYLYDHLSYLRKKFGIRHITFYDDQFTFNRKRVAALTDLMIQNPIGISFNCVVRAEHIDPALLGQLKAAGCWMISIGIETGDEALLARHRKNADLGMLAKKIRMIKKAGIRTKGLLMMGLPGETEASIKKSMAYVRSLPIDDFNLAKFTPFPGSPIYENIHELGEFNEDWGKMDCMNFLFIPKGMTKETMEALFTDFYKSHFMRPKVLWEYFSMIWKSPDSWRRFILNAGDFLKFAKNSNRMGDV